MNCNEIGEHLMDVAAGIPPAGHIAQHLSACGACAARVESLRRTMALLDEWQAPEPSPYFNTRLAARLREEGARPRGLFAWIRKPVLAAAMAALMTTAGLVSLYQLNRGDANPVQAQPGTAVGDLQDLEKNSELFANFDLLDDLAQEQHPNPQAINP